MRSCNSPPLKDEVSGLPPLAAVNEVNNNLISAEYAVAEKQFFWGNTLGNEEFEELKECY